jgi:hypothetical protein
MSRDRTRTRDRPGNDADEFTAEFEIGDDEPTERAKDGRTEVGSNGLRGRVSTRVGRLFSVRLFVAALLLSAGGIFAGNAVLPLPGAGLLGIFVVTFLFGLVVDERRYAETALAGGIAATVSAFLDFALLAFLGSFGVPLAVGAFGVIIGALGNYFGRDLRDGLTRDI